MLLLCVVIVIVVIVVVVSVVIVILFGFVKAEKIAVKTDGCGFERVDWLADATGDCLLCRH